MTDALLFARIIAAGITCPAETRETAFELRRIDADEARWLAMGEPAFRDAAHKAASRASMLNARDDNLRRGRPLWHDTSRYEAEAAHLARLRADMDDELRAFDSAIDGLEKQAVDFCRYRRGIEAAMDCEAELVPA